MIIRYVFIVLLGFWLSPCIQAQQLERVVINSTGGSFTSSTGSLSSNLGEVVSSSYENSSFSLSQGFLQPVSQLATGLETLYKELGFSYYPNPASYSFTLESEALGKIKQVVFYDAAGRLAKTIAFGQHQLGIASLQYGFYLVQALDKNGVAIHSFKLLKQ